MSVGGKVVKDMMKAVEAEKQKNFKMNRNVSTVEVYLPQFYFWAGLVCGSVNLTVALLALFLGDDIFRYIGVGYFGLWFLACGLIVWVSKIWNIVVCQDKGYFYYTTVFYRVYKCYFNECEVICHTRNRIIIKSERNNKTFYTDPHAINVEILLQHLNKNI